MDLGDFVTAVELHKENSVQGVAVGYTHDGACLLVRGVSGRLYRCDPARATVVPDVNLRFFADTVAFVANERAMLQRREERR